MQNTRSSPIISHKHILVQKFNFHCSYHFNMLQCDGVVFNTYPSFEVRLAEGIHGTVFAN